MADPVDRFTAAFGMTYAVLIGFVARAPRIGLAAAAGNAALGWALLRSAPRLRGAANPVLAYAGALLPPMAFFAFYRESMLALGSPALVFHDAGVVAAERGASALIPTAPWSWVGEWFALAYVTYVPLLFLTTAVLFGAGHRGVATPVARTLRCICYAWAACFMLYLICPVLGPRFLDPGLQIARLGEGPFSRLAVANHGLMLRGGAFPSAHVAATTVALLALWRWRRGVFWVLLPFGMSLAAGAVYLGYHYVADVVAGGVLGACVVALDVRLCSEDYATASAHHA